MKSSKTKIILMLVALLFTMSTVWFYLQYLEKNILPTCHYPEIIGASIKVKNIEDKNVIGLNADTDSLQFGVVSPGVTARRSIKVHHSVPANARVSMEGPLGAWTSISPSAFSLADNQSLEVFFTVFVPLSATEGDYIGNATFCFQE